MTYNDTLAYLFKQLPMYQRVGQAAYKADLTSTHRLMKLLGQPQKDLICIHIGGTNGKGSTSHLLASILQEAGYKTGLYTSPHLVDFRERIQINGHMISENEVVEFVEAYKEAFEAIDLSFFEWSVGLAFHHFKKEQVDVVVLEVGMGGRLDSTNVVDPVLSVITNIGMDHTQFLGDTAALIAREKAGIIKKNRPVVIGKSQRETEGIFRKIALEKDARITFADQQFPMDVPSTPLTGAYQDENFQTVLIACEELVALGWKIEEQHITRGFANVIKNTGLRGRWEVLQEAPRVICDVGHNKEGLGFSARQVVQENKGKLFLILGFVNDKNVDELLPLFPADATYLLTAPSIPRAMPITDLSETATRLGIKHDLYHGVSDAYASALKRAKKEDTIFIGGSTFVVADLLKYLS